jgi:ATP-dependent helicase/nuclease subunit A
MLSACEFALAERDIPYTVAGRNFFEADEVNDAICMLELILEPDNPTALATVLRGPWLSLSDETLLALVSPERGLVPPDAWTIERVPDPERHSLAELRAFLAESRENIDEACSAELLQSAVDTFALEEVFRLMPRGRERIANLEKLLSMACDKPDPRTFCRYVRAHAERGTREGEADFTHASAFAVRLLTVHASKGLDFPVVVLPEVNLRLPGGARPLAVFAEAAEASPKLCTRAATTDGVRVDPPTYIEACRERTRRERAERQRLWYVAVTRATDRMHLVGRAQVRSAPGSSAAAALETLLAEGCPWLTVIDVGAKETK